MEIKEVDKIISNLDSQMKSVKDRSNLIALMKEYVGDEEKIILQL